MTQRFVNYIINNQIIFALLIIAGVWFFVEIKSILISLFVAYIVMSAMLPFVRSLTKKGLPHVIAVIVAYLAMLLLIVLLIVPLIPFFVEQVTSLFNNFPHYLDQLGKSLGFKIDAKQIEDYFSREINSVGSNAISLTTQVFGGLFSTLTVLIVSFYLLLDHDSFKRWTVKLFNKGYRPRVYSALKEVDEKLGAWLRGQATLCFSIGILTWLILSILGVPNALPLAMIAGMLEIIPTLGPIVSAIPAIIIALTISPTLAIAVVVAYIFIQFLENNILVPKVMQRAVGLNPIIIIIAVSIGAKLLGIEGALLSIPFVSFLTVLANSLSEENLT